MLKKRIKNQLSSFILMFSFVIGCLAMAGGEKTEAAISGPAAAASFRLVEARLLKMEIIKLFRG